MKKDYVVKLRTGFFKTVTYQMKVEKDQVAFLSMDTDDPILLRYPRHEIQSIEVMISDNMEFDFITKEQIISGFLVEYDESERLIDRLKLCYEDRFYVDYRVI